MDIKGYKLIPQVIRKSSSFQRDFKLLVSLGEKQIKKLAIIGESEHGFDVPDELISNISADLGIEEQNLATILTVIQFLYSSAFTQEIDVDEASKEVCKLAKELGVTDCDDKYSAIHHLFEKKESYEYRILEAATESAVVPIIRRTAIECDVRAVTDPATDKILGYVPIALVNMEAEYPEGENKSMTFQMKEEHVDNLLESLKRAKSLLAKLKEEFGRKNSVNK